jgi:hypothetical protein
VNGRYSAVGSWNKEEPLEPSFRPQQVVETAGRDDRGALWPPVGPTGLVFSVYAVLLPEIVTFGVIFSVVVTMGIDLEAARRFII